MFRTSRGLHRSGTGCLQAPRGASSNESHLSWPAQALRKSLMETARVKTEVPEAPVYRPSAEEWEDPLAYIASIQEAAAKAGIAKIIPPTGARPSSPHAGGPAWP